MSSKAKPRASRRTRAPKRGVRLRDRDVEILLAIAKMRLVRTTELTRLFFDSKGTCQKRLRKLFDAGLVRAVVTDLASENRYAITRLGHTFLENALDEDEVPVFRAAPRVEGRSVVHLDLLNAYRVGLAVGAQEVGVEVLQFRPEWELRSEDSHVRPVPDALVSLQIGHRVANIAVEVDTGTEALHIIKTKLLRYAEVYANRRRVFGAKIDVLLFLVWKPRRAKSIAKLLMGTAAASAVLLGLPPVAMQSGGLMSGLWKAEVLTGVGAEGGGKEGIVPAICRIRRGS